MSNEKKLELPERIENNPNYIYGCSMRDYYKFDTILAQRAIEALKKEK